MERSSSFALGSKHDCFVCPTEFAVEIHLKNSTLYHSRKIRLRPPSRRSISFFKPARTCAGEEAPFLLKEDKKVCIF